MEVKCIEQGWKHSLFVLPGWGFDVFAFPLKELHYNIHYCEDMAASDLDDGVFTKKVSGYINESCPDGISFLAWSAGGFFLDLILKSGLLKVPIRNLYIAAVARSFKTGVLEKIRHGLDTFGIDYFHRFYKIVWAPDAPDEDYIAKRLQVLDLELLGRELDVLISAHSLDDLLKRKDAVLYYGDKDMLLSHEQLLEIRPDMKFVKDVGHMPFLKQEVIDDINTGA